MPVERLVLIMGLPTTISMLVTTFYNLADTYFVGKLGTSATGAIGIVFPLMSVIQAIGFMLGQGAGSNISRLLGARDHEKAGIFGSVSFFVCLILSVFFMIVGIIFIEPLMVLLGSSDTILPYATTYGRFILMAVPAMMCSFVLNNMLRFEGRASLAMIGLILGGLLNVIGDWITISLLGMGIEGVGLATMLSNYVSMSILLSMFLRGKTMTKLRISRLRMLWKRPEDTSGDPEKLKTDADDTDGRSVASHPYLLSIILIGLPSLARQSMSAISTAIMNIFARPYGDAAIAAMSIVMRIAFMLFAVGLGIGQGFQPVCGFNYGAGKYDRVRREAIFTWIFGTIVLTAFVCFGWIFAEDWIRVFRDDPKVLEIGLPALRYQMMSLVIVPIGVVSNMLFQSVGKSGRALFLSCLRNGICYIPVLIVTGSVLGLFGIQIAQPISDVLTAMISLPFFLSFMKTLKESATTAVN